MLTEPRQKFVHRSRRVYNYLECLHALQMLITSIAQKAAMGEKSEFNNDDELLAWFWAIGPRGMQGFILFFMTFLYLW